MTDTDKDKINYALDMAISDAPVKMTIDQVKLVREDILNTLTAAGLEIVPKQSVEGVEMWAVKGPDGKLEECTASYWQDQAEKAFVDRVGFFGMIPMDAWKCREKEGYSCVPVTVHERPKEEDKTDE